MRRRNPNARLAPVLAWLVLGSVVAGGCGTGSPDLGAPATTVPTERSSAPGTTPATAAAVDSGRFPGVEWDHVDAAEAGLDQAVIDDLADRAEQAESNCFLVARHGEIVDERYWNGTAADSAQEVFSVTKSFTSLLIGIAQAQDELAVSDAAATYIPEWRGGPSATVTVENLLSNDSGRHWDHKTDYVDMTIAAEDKTAFSIALGQDGPPGTIWAYNNSAIQTLSQVIESATGENAGTYAANNLLGPIGMADSHIRNDASGRALVFMGLQSTCRDLARFGLLMLRDGNWDGRQIVPADYVDEAVGRPSQELNAAYGFLFWLNRRGPIGSPQQATTGKEGGDVADGQLVPGAPDDLFWALGAGNQIVSMDPGSDTVVVRLGPGPLRPRDDAPSFTQADAAELVTRGVPG